ncbi:MerR family transcriptional regulator [Bacillus spongiae]|uniref:MerR family transcriptional regulator n=1 Tax=Bacillus spongiae TaxID=2683610 RepID=A0ABU8HE61_9BACI
MYSIGEVAKMIGVSTHTLRYYEKEKIIIPNRNKTGDRMYEVSHLKWLLFVLKLKETQMPIAKIKQYADLVREGEHTTFERLALLEEHQRSIQDQLENLQSTEKMLQGKITTYKAFLNDQSPSMSKST